MEEKDDEKQAIVVRKPQLDSLIPDAANLTKVAQALRASGMWRGLKTDAEYFAVIEFGRELGFAPVAALNTIVPINGRLTMMSQLMLAVAHQRGGVTWKVDRQDDKGCVMTFKKPGFDPMTVSFEEKDAIAAGLLGKDNWRKWPKAMYFARCSSLVRQIDPGSLSGLYSREEMEDTIMPGQGEIREVEVVPEPAPKPEPKKRGRKPKAEAKPEPEREPGDDEEEDAVTVGADFEEEAEAEPKKPAEPAVAMASEEAQKEVYSLLDTLIDNYKRTPGGLLEAIAGLLKRKFGTTRAHIPQDLTANEAIVVSGALQKTIEAEEAKAKPKSEGEAL